MTTNFFRYGTAVLLAFSLTACGGGSGDDSDSDSDSDGGTMMGSPGVTASPPSGNTSEAGTTATFTVVLDAEPTADVTVTVVSGDTSEITVQSGDSLTFTAADWNTPQTVTLVGVDDALFDGTVVVNITATAGNTGGYNGENASVSVGNEDNEASVEVPASKDNMLYETSDDPAQWSNGGGQNMYVGRIGNNAQAPLGVLRRGLLAFDVAGSVPAGATILSVTIRLHVNNVNNDTARDIGLHRLLVDWGEGTVNALGNEAGGNDGAGLPAAQAGDATWTHHTHDGGAGGEWTAAGGQAVADYSATAGAVQSVGGMGSYEWSNNNSNTLLAEVQDMLDNPGTNFGWMLLGDESVIQTVKVVSTREHPTSDNHPVMVIGYSN